MLSRGDGVVLGERADRAALLKKTMRGASYAVARRWPGEPIRRFEAARRRPLGRRIRLRARRRDRGSVTRHQTYYTFVGAGRFDGLFVLLFSTCTAKPNVVVVYAVCELQRDVRAARRRPRKTYLIEERAGRGHDFEAAAHLGRRGPRQRRGVLSKFCCARWTPRSCPLPWR